MATEFKLPEVSEGVTSVDVAEILVAVGDTITAGTIICEVETDKAVAEIECPLAGTIKEIRIAVGDSVPVGQPILLIEESSTAATAPPATAPPAPAKPATPAAATPAAAKPAAAKPAAAKPAKPAAAAAAEAPRAMGTPQTIEFKLPEVSEGVATVDIAEILVAVGDVIAADAVVCEVETDKAVAEINCPHAGTVKAVLVNVGDTVAVGTALISVETSVGGSAAAAPSNTAPAAKASPVASAASAASPSAPQTAPLAAAAPALTGSSSRDALRLPLVRQLDAWLASWESICIR